jgi:hypothetical protein
MQRDVTEHVLQEQQLLDLTEGQLAMLSQVCHFTPELVRDYVCMCVSMCVRVYVCVCMLVWQPMMAVTCATWLEFWDMG